LRDLKNTAKLDAPDMELYSWELKVLNAALCDIEDEICELEARQEFGPRFVELTRSVYRTNDPRARVEHRIKAAFGSEIDEEKSYKGS
jgi:hypothetical protein